MKTKPLFALAMALSLLLTASISQGADNAVKPPMIGHWEGDSYIVVSWCRQTNLHVVLNISADGTVSGTVGDAKLTKGHFTRNRGWLGRKLNLATDYIVRGDLTGQIISAENIQRDHVAIPLNFSGGLFTGGVHSSGSKFGGKEKMVLSAQSLRLANGK